MQWDFFAAGGLAPAPSPNPEPPRSAADPAALSDAAILGAIPDAGMPLVLALIQEAGRRRLPAAIPVLGRLCQLFAGFGLEREVPEQAVALDALASIGGQDARLAVSELLDDHRVQGPTLKVAVRVAATLRCRLSAATVLPLLRHADPEVRAIACNLARPHADVNASSDRLAGRSRSNCANRVRLRARPFRKTGSKIPPSRRCSARADAGRHRSDRCDRRSRIDRAVGQTRQSPDGFDEYGTRCAGFDR